MTLDLSDLYNPNVLNIFCDASTREYSALLDQDNTVDTCYGAVATSNGIIIDDLYRISCFSTCNRGEILAIKYGKSYQRINLFSDNQICILGIRDRIYNWELSEKELYNSTGGIVASQDIYLEIMYLMNEYHTAINFWHQKGHINPNNPKQIRIARELFSKSNKVKIDTEATKYISHFNGMVDTKSREILHNY